MSLYKEWVKLMDKQTEETFDEFWKEYSSTEQRIYEYILENHQENLKGKFSDLVAKFEANPVIFMGFIDGINSSLIEAMDLDSITEDSELEFKIDLEKLFFNMLKAEADYLYGLSQWNSILSEDKQLEILKDYRRSRIVKKEKEPGRNDPCPCGSGKKYKKCCGSGK